MAKTTRKSVWQQRSNAWEKRARAAERQEHTAKLALAESTRRWNAALEAKEAQATAAEQKCASVVKERDALMERLQEEVDKVRQMMPEANMGLELREQLEASLEREKNLREEVRSRAEEVRRLLEKNRFLDELTKNQSTSIGNLAEKLQKAVEDRDRLLKEATFGTHRAADAWNAGVLAGQQMAQRQAQTRPPPGQTPQQTQQTQQTQPQTCRCSDPDWKRGVGEMIGDLVLRVGRLEKKWGVRDGEAPAAG